MKRYRKKGGISRLIAILTTQSLLYKIMSTYFLESSISENTWDLKRRGCILTLL